jgi:hypothetical protein
MAKIPPRTTKKRPEPADPVQITCEGYGEGPEAPRPELHVAKGSELTLDHIILMYKRLTGRDPTPEEIEVSRAQLEAARRRTPPTGKETDQ